MVKMIIFDPAMCCSMGLCGPVIDMELLRISTSMSNMEKNGVKVERYNLSGNPQAFVGGYQIRSKKSRSNLTIVFRKVSPICMLVSNQFNAILSSNPT